jgi:transmembrane sensor
MRDHPDTVEREAFAAWVASSPLHVRELLLVGMLDRELSRPGALDSFDVDAIIARAAAGDNVVLLPKHTSHAQSPERNPSQSRRVARWIRATGVAAVVLLSAASWIGVRQYASSGMDYATAVGEQRSIRLADGTIVSLAPDSRIGVAFSLGTRDVTLRQGEAQFAVIHSAARPFRVYAGASKIQDVGTLFTVNRLPSGTTVSVAEGSVQITADHFAALQSGVGEWVASWLPGGAAAIERPGVEVVPLDHPVDLTAGEAVHISRNGKALTRGTADEGRQASVNARRLTFHDDTLADIVTEFNRYNPRQIVVDGDATQLQRYSGVFDASDASSFLQFLDCCSTLAVTHHGDRILIRARVSGASAFKQ